MGPAGAGSLAQVVNAALGNRARFESFREFFEGVGTGHNAGVWEGTPEDRPEFREAHVRKLAKAAAKKKDAAAPEGMV
jgi:chlorophyllide a reductase subunit Y